MSYKAFITSFAFIWVAYYIFFVVSVINTASELKTNIVYNSSIRVNGAFGVIKHYYIESNLAKSSQPKKQVIDRLYSGFSLARLLVPKSAINEQKHITFYALYKPEKVIHFAANAGDQSASKFRLYIDIIAYFIIKYGILHLGMLLFFGFSENIYSGIFKAENPGLGIFEANNYPILKPMLLYMFYFSLIVVLL